MYISLKRGIKIGLIVAACLLLAVGACYYVLLLNAKAIVKYAVSKQTADGYVIDSETIRLSLLDKTIRIDKLVLTRRDTASIPVYCDVKIPKAYLSIDSWRELLINKRVSVDSLSIEHPDIVIHDYRIPETGRHLTSFHTAMILENLQLALDHFHAKAFTIRHGSLMLYKRTNPVPFHLNDITVIVRNFLKIDNNDKHVFGSDYVELAIGRQHWQLSDGENSLSFTGLRFSSTTQLVEIDSVFYRKPAANGQGETSLRADKFFFTSSHLPAIYQKGKLQLDTLVCVRPVLTLPMERNKNQYATGRTNLQSLFNDITIRHAAIKDGEVIVAGQTNKVSRAGTKKANLTIQNLSFRPGKRHSLTAGSIRLNLNNIAFYSKDSLFKIAVESFALFNKDVVFNRVSYGPVAPHVAGSQLTFTAPALRLRNISLEDLLRKRLIATDAELVRPVLTFSGTTKVPFIPRSDTATGSPHTKPTMYQTLHGLAELLQVETFRVVDASAHYAVSVGKPVRVDLKNLNTTIRLRKLLLSDSLADMMHAMPTLTIGQVRAATTRENVLLSQYAFNGKNRYNRLGKFHLKTANGTTLSGEKLSWTMVQKMNAVQIERLQLGTLTIDAKADSSIKPALSAHGLMASAATPVVEKPLPRLQIGQLVIGQIRMNAALPNQTLAGFVGEGIRIDKLMTDDHHLRWMQFGGKLTHFYYNQTGGKQITAEKLVLNSQHSTTLTNLAYVDNGPGRSLRFLVPQAAIRGPLLSTDFSTIKLSSVQLEQPRITIITDNSPQPIGAANTFSIPVTLGLDQLNVNQANVTFTGKKGADSTHIQTRMNMVIVSLQTQKHKAVTFASVRVSPIDLALEMPTLTTTVPSATMQLANGKLATSPAGKPVLTAHLTASWVVDELHPRPLVSQAKKPVSFRVQGITGTVDLPNFYWTAEKKIPWTTWVNHANVTIKKPSVKSATTHAEAEQVTWLHGPSQLEVENFKVSPATSKQETLERSPFQKDYISMRGRKVQLLGIQTNQWSSDSAMAIHHIILDGIDTDVSRDKRLPVPASIPHKRMPTRLLSGITLPFRVDSIRIINSRLTYHETSKITNQVGTIPLTEINGVVKNITNRPTRWSDSLSLLASTKLLGLSINQMHYRESYGDSLSGFRMILQTSGMHLPELTQITKPVAAAGLEGGYLEPVLIRMAGNNYASVGTMRFFYKDLKLRLLGKTDAPRKSLLIRVENFVIGHVLRKKNQQEAPIFYSRDQTKFVFGYWIKSIMSGVLVSVGVKGNKAYHANYVKLRQQHTLPDEN